MSNVIVPLVIVTAASLGLTVIVRWHARTFGYRCPECGHEFQISAWTDFKSPHFPHKKRLTCPSCHKRNWCEAVPVEKMSLP